MTQKKGINLKDLMKKVPVSQQGVDISDDGLIKIDQGIVDSVSDLLLEMLDFSDGIETGTMRFFSGHHDIYSIIRKVTMSAVESASSLRKSTKMSGKEIIHSVIMTASLYIVVILLSHIKSINSRTTPSPLNGDLPTIDKNTQRIIETDDHPPHKLYNSLSPLDRGAMLKCATKAVKSARDDMLGKSSELLIQGKIDEAWFNLHMSDDRLVKMALDSAIYYRQMMVRQQRTVALNKAVYLEPSNEE